MVPTTYPREQSSQHPFRFQSCLTSVPDGPYISQNLIDEEYTSSCCKKLLPAACRSIYFQKCHYTLMSLLEASTFQPAQLLQGSDLLSPAGGWGQAHVTAGWGQGGQQERARQGIPGGPPAQALGPGGRTPV